MSIIHHVKEDHQQSKAMEFMDICSVSQLNSNLKSKKTVKWWDGSQTKIWTDWDLCTHEQIWRWQYSINKFFSDEDRIASNWLQVLVFNSSTDSLCTAVAKSTTNYLSTRKEE